jgi:hypothetical protein
MIVKAESSITSILKRVSPLRIKHFSVAKLQAALQRHPYPGVLLQLNIVCGVLDIDV